MQRLLENPAALHVTTGDRLVRCRKKLPQLVRGDRTAPLCMRETIVEHGAKRRGAERAAEVACEQVRGRDAAALRPIDDFLDQDQRTYADQTHAKSHHEGTKRGNDRRALWVQENEGGGPG